jgi:Zn-dependent metalloprotease
MRPRWPGGCCLVPPYVLEHVARHGDETQRRRAAGTLAIDHSFRSGRGQFASVPDVLTTLPAGRPRRTIYDARSSEDLSGAPVVRAEGATSVSDSAANEAYDNLGSTHTYYWEVHRRNSIDDRGLPLDAYVHFGEEYDNSMWDAYRMLFGDGDGKVFTHPTRALEVVGHELTHGVTQYTVAFAYQEQSGSLNESVADVFGSLVKQYALRQSAEDADWLIGADCLGSQVEGTALRSLAAPGTAYSDMLGQKDPQPAHMRDYVRTTAGYGAMHVNSGIPSHAFYLIATAIGGNAWEKAGRIWYETIRDPGLRPTVRFQAFAATTFRAAARLYGSSSAEAAAVHDGWQQVGIQI